MPQPLAIRETASSLTEAVTPVGETGARISVQLITPGWGSSGYYSPQVLTEAATRKVFPAGTHMYLDHPTMSEAEERPERSVRDLAAVLVTDATVDSSGGLVAEADVLPPYRELVAEAKDAIGVSIRAAGIAETGEAEGRTGPIVTALTEGLSVDFVTHAGRGGRVLALLESARAAAQTSSAAQWISRVVPAATVAFREAMIPLREGHGMTANDLRDAVSSAVRDAHAGDKQYAWVRDYTDEWVVFELETPNSNSLMQQTYTVTNGAVSMTGTPVEVTARTTYVPVNPAGQSIPTTESEEDTMPHIEAAQLRQLEEAAGRVQALEAERDTERQRATKTTVLGEAERLSQLLAESRTALAEANARADKAEQTRATAERRATLVEAQRGAEVKARAALASSDLKEAAWGDVVARVCDSLELTESGKVDDAKLTTAIEAEIQAERTKVARLMEAYGVGTVAGLGGNPGEEQFSEADFEAGMTDVFTSLGLNEADAKTAAKGR